MRSLTLKLVVAFLVVSLVGTVLLAVVTGRMTASEFGSFVHYQEQEALAQRLGDYYRQQGSWDGVSAILQGMQMGGQFGLGPPPATGGQGRGQGRNRVALFDASGVVVVSGMGYREGEAVSPAVIQEGAPVIVDGQMVGTVVQTRGTPAVTTAGAAFLERINHSLVLAALGATLVALLLGTLLARTLTRPLRELTEAAQAVARGELGLAVQVPSQDELGDLAAAFNQMSADLARAQERRRQMTADIAHDLRTPISIIQGHAEALNDGVLPPTAETFSLIHDEALRLNRMVEDLRTLSRAEAGDLPLVRRPVDIRPWLQNLVDAHGPRAARQDITLQTAIDGDGFVVMDADRLTQAMNNLIDNALRHTPEGGSVIIGARTHRFDSAIHLYVQDSGPGIAPQDLPHVFERFYRADKSRRRQEGGTGLGLAIARSIVEMHGGRIWAENAPQSGALFTIALDVAESEAT